MADHDRHMVTAYSVLDCGQSLFFFGIVEQMEPLLLGLAPLFLAAREIRIAHSTIPKKNNDCSQSDNAHVLEPRLSYISLVWIELREKISNESSLVTKVFVCEIKYALKS